MSQIKLMKYTFHKPDGKQFHAYLKDPSPTFQFLKSEVKISLFELHDQDFVELRFYWIDEDNDEIELSVQNDYDVFLMNRSTKKHLHVTGVSAAEEQTASSSSTNVEAEPDNTAQSDGPQTVHNFVECDNCMVAPIVGFRYKCLQCPDFDLCGQCEQKHKHPEHIMVRFPTPTTTKIDIFGAMSGRGMGRHRKRHCPFIPPSVATGESLSTAQPTNEGAKERHHHRRKTREMRSSFFSNLYNIMQDLAEGGASNCHNNEAKSPEKNEPEVEQRSPNETETNESKKVGEEAINTSNGQTAGAESQELPPFPQMAENENATAYAERVKAYTSLMGKSIEDMIKATDAVKIAAELAKAKSLDLQGAPSGSNVNKSNPPDLVENVTGMGQVTIDEIIDVVPAPIMKTGIEILQNVSEIFSRLLDPVEGKNGASTPRKMSTVSQSSSSTQTAEQSEPTPNAPELVEQVNAELVTSDISTSQAQEDSGKRESLRRESSDENDWQIIDEKSASAGSPQVQDNNEQREKNAKDKEVTYAQLLSHLETEKRAQNVDLATAVGSAETAAMVASTQPTVDSTLGDPQVTTTILSTGAIPKTSEERRSNITYHPNTMINDAIVAMMAMGFSNEGAWLTQLLESVNGNISEALDLMNAVQYNNRN